ncbi:autoinducer binding domain-containing protein [Granulosicoccus sp. 3-233]|uniref:autoinducer binding domain-containing protein n=1 Tax=Granulosicoccus sp. 3-233 TaxID=3417969 RepID=UPI003D35706B
MQASLHDYVEALLKADSFETAFDIYQQEVVRLGFDGVLYSIIPQAIIQTEFQINPVYIVSSGYESAFLDHYQQAQFFKYDPLIVALQEGTRQTLDWDGEIASDYILRNAVSREIMEVARSYGLRHGLTIPLMSDERGVAAASIVSRESSGFEALKQAALPALETRTTLFHNRVMTTPDFSSTFSKPLLDTFNTKQLGYVLGLASGLSTEDIAYSLGTSVGYLEQSMLKLRRKLSGVSEFDSASVNRNQIMYTAGLLHLLRDDVLKRVPPLRERPGKSKKSGKTTKSRKAASSF